MKTIYKSSAQSVITTLFGKNCTQKICSESKISGVMSKQLSRSENKMFPFITVYQTKCTLPNTVYFPTVFRNFLQLLPPLGSSTQKLKFHQQTDNNTQF